MISPRQVAVAAIAYEEAMYGVDNTTANRMHAMRAALEAATMPHGVAMCETCFTTWPINNAPAVCPVCNKGRA